MFDKYPKIDPNVSDLVTYVWCVMFDKNPKINETKINVWCVMFDK